MLFFVYLLPEPRAGDPGPPVPPVPSVPRSSVPPPGPCPLLTEHEDLLAEHDATRRRTELEGSGGEEGGGGGTWSGRGGV